MKTYCLPTIPFLKLRFHLKALQYCSLPLFKASMIRGAFGNALRRTVCIMGRDKSCEKCMLRSQCIYTHIFETFIENDPPPFLKGIRTSPRPYVFLVNEQKTDYFTDDCLTVEMTLFGKAWEVHPYVIFAMGRACDSGFTRQRFGFHLDKVSCFADGWQDIYNGRNQTLDQIAKPDILHNTSETASHLLLQFMTPVQMKFNHQRTSDFTFRMFAFKVLRRALEIAHFYGSANEIDWDFSHYLDLANGIDITNKQLKWQEYIRYSSSQKKKIKLGGYVGELELQGELTPFLHLLRLCEVLHVGKGTVFGLGHVEVRL